MHLWKKEILFFLSLMLGLASCEGTDEIEQTVEETDHIGAFFDVLFHKKNLTIKDLDSDSLRYEIQEIDELENGINGFTIENDIEPGKIIFTASSDSLFQPYVDRLNSEFKNSYQKYDSYQIWGKNDTFNLEISLSPHPVEEWILMIRE